MEILELTPRKPANLLHGANSSELVIGRSCQTLSALALQITSPIDQHWLMWVKRCGFVSDCFIPTRENLSWSLKRRGFLS